MRIRQKALSVTLVVFALNSSSTNARKLHFAGLGDGNIDHGTPTKQLLRGSAANRRKKKGRTRAGDQDDILASDVREVALNDSGRDTYDESDVADSLQKRENRRAASLTHREDIILDGADGVNNPSLASDGPWQLSVLMLLGIMGVLVGLFLHLSTDPTAHYIRRRVKTYENKKSDPWIDDVEDSEEDNYTGDNEGDRGGSIAKKRSSMPKTLDDSTATSYYQLNTRSDTNCRRQEHRKRKTATQQPPKNTSTGAGGGGSIPESTVPVFHSPCRSSRLISLGYNNRNTDKTSCSSVIPTPPSHSAVPAFRPSRSSTSPGYKNRDVEKSTPFPSPPFAVDESGSGHGLDSFEIPGPLTDAGMKTSKNIVPTVKALVKPMGTFTSLESFESMSSATGEQSRAACPLREKTSAVGSVEFTTLSKNLYEGAANSFLSASSPWHSRDSRQCLEKLSDIPTPRVDHTRRKLEPQSLKQMNKNSSKGAERGHTIDETEHETEAGTLYDAKENFSGISLGPVATGRSSSLLNDAPRSLALEELQLVRMESGVSGPRWRTMHDLEQSTASIEEQKQQNKNEEKIREASAAVDPVDDPRNSIQHIRKDLTMSSDASSSLSSRINFSELVLADVIGGGGFGQVWRATWKGTPVAVKVLTGSAQAETVPKAVLEEFIAEINMVSGMRHPNICLFMGACLEPPNRAIVTELLTHGSLWDAIRSPLSLPYQVADGKTRQSWPLSIYNLSTSVMFEPPLVPEGIWPWELVKRVAAGTARGMCYLHGGSPPVLHRDLKSANILLDESYTAKLADFGLSRLKAVQSGMTGNCGTVQWMAPEVLCNEIYAEPADVFSFGIILWEMLTKECPYDGMSPIQCALSVLNKNNRPEIPEWCPQPLRALIENCVEKNPHSRPTFSQILSAIDALEV